MGRMKELWVQIMEANNGIPDGMTIKDLAEMNDLKMFNYKEYQRNQDNEQEKRNKEKIK